MGIAPRVFSDFIFALGKPYFCVKTQHVAFRLFQKFYHMLCLPRKVTPPIPKCIAVAGANDIHAESSSDMKRLFQWEEHHKSPPNLITHFACHKNSIHASSSSHMERANFYFHCISIISFLFSVLLYSALPFFSNNLLFFVFFSFRFATLFFVSTSLLFSFLDCARMFVYRKFSKYSKERSFD